MSEGFEIANNHMTARFFLKRVNDTKERQPHFTHPSTTLGK